MHLVDIGRAEIEKQEKRPWADRLLRHVLSITVPYASRFHLALRFCAAGQTVCRAAAWTDEGNGGSGSCAPQAR